MFNEEGHKDKTWTSQSLFAILRTRLKMINQDG